MDKQLNFTLNKPQQFRDMGGQHFAIYAGRCLRCNRRIYGVSEQIGTRPTDPDPRGVIPPGHALSSLVAEEYGAQGKLADARFCYDCLWEHGSEQYEHCLLAAKKAWGAA